VQKAGNNELGKSSVFSSIWGERELWSEKVAKFQTWLYTPIIPVLGGQRQEDLERSGVHSHTLSQKTEGWGWNSEVEHLPSMWKALGLIPALQKKPKKHGNRGHWTIIVQNATFSNWNEWPICSALPVPSDDQ
jgi:hypothetical protein